MGEFSEYNNLPDNVLDETSQFFIAVNLEDSKKKFTLNLMIMMIILELIKTFRKLLFI